MLSFVLASFLFILICVISLIISYYAIVLMNEDKTSPEPGLNAIIATNVMLLFNYVTDAIADTLEVIIAKGADLIQFLRKNWLAVLRTLGLLGLVIAINSDLAGCLRTFDKFFRCLLQPLVQNVLFAILHVLRIIFDGIIPLYNYYQMAVAQFWTGSVTLAVKCDIKAVYHSLKTILSVVIAQFESVYDFSGARDGMSVENNIFVNEFNITKIFEKTQLVLYEQKTLVNCACDGLSDVAELFFVLVNTPHPPRMINHFFNVFVSTIQMLVQVSPPFSKSPSLDKIIYHANGALFEFGSYVDTLIVRWAEIIIGFFDKNFSIEGVPKNFVGTSLARFGMGFVHLFHTMVRSIIGIVVPIKHFYQDAHYMVQLTSIDHAIIQWRLGIEHLSTCIFYFASIIELFISDTVVGDEGKRTLPTLPAYVDLDCYVKPGLNQQARTISCLIQMPSLLFINVIHVGYSLLMELLWKSLIFQEQSVLRTIQRYDGLSYSKVTPITCELRKRAKEDGWDLTNKDCLCEKIYDFKELEYSEMHPFGVKRYDPYCGQPNLQANVFGVAERIISYGGNFFGIKYLYAFQQNIFFIGLEILKVLIKTVLNFYDIGRGNYFTYPMNCGYGVSELALEEWWISEGKDMNSELCVGQVIGLGAWQSMIKKNYNDYIALEVGNSRNINKYIDPVYKDDYSGGGHFRSGQYTSSFYKTIVTDGVARTAKLVCYPKHEFLRFYRCIKTKYNGEDYCDQNKNGCTCNTLSSLQPDSHCQCIYNFPDTEQEASQTTFFNPLLESMEQNYFHLCNTYFAEHILYYVDKIGIFFDELITDFHPGYDVKTPIPVYTTRTDSFGVETKILSHYEYETYCATTAGAFEIYKSTVLEQNVKELFNRNKMELFNSVLANQGTTYAATRAYGQYCKTYGSKDFMCSISLGVFHTIKLFTNEARVLLISVFNFLGNPSLTNFKADFSERICDLQRSLAGVSSTISSLISGITEGSATTGVTLHRSLSKVIFTILNAFVHILQMLNLMLNWLNLVMSGRVSFGESILDLIIDQITNWVDWSIQALDALDYLVKDIIAKGGGDAGVTLFESLKTILLVIRGLLQGVVFDLVLLLIKAGTNFLKCFGSGSGCGDFTQSFIQMFNLVLNWFVTDGAKMLQELILKVLGPLGDAIRELVNFACGGLRKVLDFFGVSINIKCRRRLFAEEPFSQTFENTWSTAYSDLPGRAASELQWNGTTECDMTINSYREYTWEEMRPMEKNKIYLCLQERLASHVISKFLNLPIPHDLFYNWQRKYYMVYDFWRALLIYIQHKMGNIASYDMVTEFKKLNLDINLWLPIFQFASSNIYRVSTLDNIDKNIEWFLYNAASTPDSLFHNVRNLYNASKVVMKQAVICAESVYTDVPKIVNAVVKISPEYDIPKRLLASYRRGFDVPISTTPSQLNARKLVLRAAGLSSDTTPCDERKDSYVCTNCNLLDNFLTVLIKEGEALTKYYTYTYAGTVIPGFVTWVQEEDEEGKAWRDDFAKMMDAGIKRAAKDIDQSLSQVDDELSEWASRAQLDAQRGVRTLGKNYVNITNTSNSSYVYLTNFQRAEKDWNYLIENYELRNNNTFWEIVEDLFTKTNDEYVPLFAYSIPYYVSYPFTEACPVEIIYCERNTTSERLKLIPKGLLYYIIFVLAVLIADKYIQLPIYSFFAPQQWWIFLFVYMFTVYGWNFRCFPNIPNCVADDMLAFTNDYLFPDCFCSYFAGVAKTCNPETCFLCSKITDFHECEANIPLLEQHGIYWAPLFTFRFFLPDIMVWLFQNIPFSWFVREIHLYKSLVEKIINNVEPTGIEIDCMYLKYLDIAVVLIIFVGAAYFLSIGTSLGIRYMQHFIKIFPMFLLTVTNMATSIELQSISGLQD